VRDRRTRSLHLSSEDVDPREVTLVANPGLVETPGIFLVVQELLRAELRWTFERHTVFAFARPLAVQIGVAHGVRARHVVSRFVCASAWRVSPRDTRGTDAAIAIAPAVIVVAIRLLMPLIPRR
jgi:hypothetical protein